MSRAGGALAATAALVLGGGIASPASAAPSTDATYTVTVGTPVPFTHPTDTPASPYLDRDGTFHYQQSAALYGAADPRTWDFYTGKDFDSARFDTALSKAVNPANSADRNDDTTWRCNNSPTGREATYAPSGSGYAQKNYCDLSGVWVDPDTGDWYGLVHNEFTPQPFGDGLHYDAIDYAVSTDRGRTWTVKDHAITSPYSTKRGDTTAFPNQTYSYGDGDQRLFVDTASGYFYVYYGSRIIDKSGGWKAFYEHVARAPISAKMAPGSWQKWYDGAWSQPGTGGKESNIVPVDADHPTGHTPASAEYDPANTGTAAQQIAAGTMPPTSPLFVMNIAYDAYLGLYIGEPQAVDQSGKSPQYLYATDDLTTQKWHLIGDTGSYTNASWYRWFLDSANRTSSTVVGKSFRSYCAFGCSHDASGEYVDLTVDSTTPAAAPMDTGRAYRIASGAGRILAQSAGGSATTSLTRPAGHGRDTWVFTPTGDGAFTIAGAANGRLLGVDSSSGAGRAWGAKPTVTAPRAGGPSVGQQWFVIADATGGGYRLVNRYSGLVLGLSGRSGRLAETTPVRDWTDSSGSSVGAGRTAAEQTLSLTAT
ncbi:RICIN domain-containing protein [Streptomyces yokosukanensis]|uniref:RICIN domain-containing protein n=1 Tax=Streptomyces yokosukanensis TaxID=67386 RepID=UPI00341B7BFD